MTVTKVKIANMALSHIGESTIESTTELSAEAGRVDIFYDVALQRSLEWYNWPFARRSQTLALHVDAAPKTRWQFRYALPSDLVKCRFIENVAGADADPIPYALENDDAAAELTLLTDVQEASLIYTFLMEQPERFPADFVLGLSHQLAYLMAYSQTGKRALAGDQLNLFQTFMAQAAASALNEEMPGAPREAEAIRARA